MLHIPRRVPAAAHLAALLAGLLIGLLWMLPAAAPLAAQGNSPLILYVALNGNDGWSGRLPEPNAARSDGPFQTLERANEELRRLRSTAGLPAAGVAVELRGGVYERLSSLSFGPQQSGTPQAPVVFRPYGNETVRLVGGRRIDGTRFAPVSDPTLLARIDPAARTAIRQLDLRAQGISDFGTLRDRNSGFYNIGALELFFNAQPMQLARWPNAPEWARIPGEPGTLQNGGFSYSGDRPARWQNSGQIWVSGYLSFDYADRYERVRSIDTATRTVRTVHSQDPNTSYTAGQRYYFVNILEEIDQPGEWYLDRDSGQLFFWPPSDPAQAEILVSMIETPILQFTDASYIRIERLIVEVTRGVGISMEGGRGNLLAGMTLRNTGTDAVQILSGAEHGVIASEIYATGDGGIVLSGGNFFTIEPAGHYAINNFIHDYARFVKTYRPAIRLAGVGQRVSNNRIVDAPHAGIIFSGNEHLIELNEIARIGRDSGDMGAIYTGGSWTGRGTLIRHNYLHHFDQTSATGKLRLVAVYLDNLSSGTTVYGNVIYRGGDRPVFINSGPLNRVENNVFVGSELGLFIGQRGGTGPLPERIQNELRQYNPTQPPYSTRYPELAAFLRNTPAERQQTPVGNIIRRNLFYGVPTPIFLVRGLDPSIMTIEQNITLSQQGGVINFEGERLQLRFDRPEASGIGFEPIPLERIGLFLDQYRRSLP